MQLAPSQDTAGGSCRAGWGWAGATACLVKARKFLILAQQLFFLLLLLELPQPDCTEADSFRFTCENRFGVYSFQLCSCMWEGDHVSVSAGHAFLITLLQERFWKAPLCILEHKLSLEAA